MCVCVLACQHCLFPCNGVVYLSVSNSEFKRLNLAEKALVLNFVPGPRVGGEDVSVRVPCTNPEIFFTWYSLKFSLRIHR